MTRAPAARQLPPKPVVESGDDSWDGRRTQAVSALGAQVLIEATDLVAQTHAAFAGRAFDLVGPASAPVRQVHDGASTATYASVRLGVRAVGAAGQLIGHAQHALRRRRPSDTPPQPMSAKTTATLAALNGLVGDRLMRACSPLAVEMALYDVSGAPVLALPAQRRLVVLVHGLCQSEHAWQLRRPKKARGAHPSYLHAMHAAGWTPLALRYNSGRAVVDNARDLAELLQRLFEDQPPGDVALVGHSMGGLVARAACDFARAAGHQWVGRVSHLAYLGSPHEGAPLARAATQGSGLAARLPETAAVASILEYRSRGIRDLDHGLAVAPTSGEPPSGQVPLLLPGARHLAVAAALGRSCDSWSARVLGDLLVPPSSACGGISATELGFDPDGTHRLPRTGHLRLLNDARVEQLLLEHLTLPRPAHDAAIVDQPRPA